MKWILVIWWILVGLAIEALIMTSYHGSTWTDIQLTLIQSTKVTLGIAIAVWAWLTAIGFILGPLK